MWIYVIYEQLTPSKYDRKRLLKVLQHFIIFTNINRQNYKERKCKVWGCSCLNWKCWLFANKSYKLETDVVEKDLDGLPYPASDMRRGRKLFYGKILVMVVLNLRFGFHGWQFHGRLEQIVLKLSYGISKEAGFLLRHSADTLKRLHVSRFFRNIR